MYICGNTNILSDAEMIELGFTDRVETRWYRTVRLHGGADISFDVTIDKATGDYEEAVLDNEFGQHYHYASINVPVAKKVREEVDKQVALLTEAGLNVVVDHNAYRY